MPKPSRRPARTVVGIAMDAWIFLTLLIRRRNYGWFFTRAVDLFQESSTHQEPSHSVRVSEIKNVNMIRLTRGCEVSKFGNDVCTIFNWQTNSSYVCSPISRATSSSRTHEHTRRQTCDYECKNRTQIAKVHVKRKRGNCDAQHVSCNPNAFAMRVPIPIVFFFSLQQKFECIWSQLGSARAFCEANFGRWNIASCPTKIFVWSPKRTFDKRSSAPGNVLDRIQVCAAIQTYSFSHAVFSYRPFHRLSVCSVCFPHCFFSFARVTCEWR